MLTRQALLPAATVPATQLDPKASPSLFRSGVTFHLGGPEGQPGRPVCDAPSSRHPHPKALAPNRVCLPAEAETSTPRRAPKSTA